MTDFYRPARTFTATETTSDGIRIEVIVTLPDDITWTYYSECGELAQMGANRTMAAVEKSYADGLKRAADERAEVAF